jgi:myb proto-oncogene protein
LPATICILGVSIRRLVAQHGPQKWTMIAEHLPGRIGKQCRER